MRARSLKKTAVTVACAALVVPLAPAANASSFFGSSALADLFNAVAGSSMSSETFYDDSPGAQGSTFLPGGISGNKKNGDTPPPVEITPGPVRDGWRLVREETFDKGINDSKVDWEVQKFGPGNRYYVDEFSDGGKYFKIQGGEYFQRALDSFQLLRKSVPFGEDGWLTVEMAARSREKTGKPDGVPTLQVKNGEAKMDVPWDNGLIITSTNPLPSQYRVEYELKTLDFGGKDINGEWNYDGKINGYPSKTECMTNFPWVRLRQNKDGSYPTPGYDQNGAEQPDPCAKPFGDIKAENGFYLMEIVDHAHPAPHNNIFIHSHRKVGMDIYSVNGGWAKAYWGCDPSNGKLKPYADTNGHGINEIFFDGSVWRDPSFAYNEFVMPTPCGIFHGDERNHDNQLQTIVSAAEIQPHVMPNETYKFAIERTDKGYVQEMTGNFRYVGQRTYRFFRPFINNDGRAIWHYNQTPEEYDGRFNNTLKFKGPHGEFEKEMWPSDSAYPDNFIIGLPHINYYTGSATVDNIRLYVPEDKK
ncbi:hypothetical protein ACFSSC_06950 [Corynebacterium mendelii]|uniref:Uncharacterized protein n=1 Tax=Corynebacterium mendelii TaxID=2765362 RepID=A0A939IYR3_9CORY|nr:hypothetical protein [Corynebacterium mendelii]MBN9644932.1 hypothetical protein [Corynebacterium mendelii]